MSHNRMRRAIERGDIQDVKQLLQQYPEDINRPGTFVRRAMHACVSTDVNKAS
eukprot:m.232165 g.232165  ORF g.232165 m.232165 type:complete len:53 (-) comp41441_c0_seq1:21-179(-)